MSMNLYAETKDQKNFELWQTPTWITHLCLTNHKRGQRKWKDTRYLYEQWVKSHSQGVWESPEEYQEMVNSIDEHLYELHLQGKLNFYMG